MSTREFGGLISIAGQSNSPNAVNDRGVELAEIWFENELSINCECRPVTGRQTLPPPIKATSLLELATTENPPPHWWCRDNIGSIHDPMLAFFPGICGN